MLSKKKKFSLLVRIVIISLSFSFPFPTLAVSSDYNPPYPRIFNFSFGTGPAEWFAKFNIVRGPYSLYKEIKKINPDTITLVSRDWNVWELGGRRPDAWTAKHSNGQPVKTYGYLMNISDLCPLYRGQQYNSYIANDAFNRANRPNVDGFMCQGVWRHPYGEGDKDIDLDGNGVNDYSEEHPTTKNGTKDSCWNGNAWRWVECHWSRGVNKAVNMLYPKLRSIGKVLILNSGGFHGFRSNGLMLEQMKNDLYFSYTKKMYDQWMAKAPKPHLFLFDSQINGSKNDFKAMRYLLTFTLLGDGYFSFTDKDAGQHAYNKYYDEFDTNLGYPTSKALKLANCFSNNISGLPIYCWVRFFDNGVSIINPSGAKQTITDDDLKQFSEYAGPYYRFKGGQDPETNNGKIFDEVVLDGFKARIGTGGDGIILLKKPRVIVSDIIIDDSDAATSPASEPAKFEGKWVYNDKSIKNAYSLAFKPWMNLFYAAYANPGRGESTAIYTPTIGVPGNYEVFEWHGYLSSGKQEATNVPYTITYGGGKTKQGTINQSTNYGKWNSLGTYYFEKGADGNVKISNKNVNGMVIADAFKFVYKGAEYLADFNCDGKVNVQDLGILLSHWNQTKNLNNYQHPHCPKAKSLDLNANQRIDAGDFGSLLSCWGNPSKSRCLAR